MDRNTELLLHRLTSRELARIQTKLECGVELSQIPNLLKLRDQAYRAALEVGAHDSIAFTVERSKKTAAVFPFIPAIGHGEAAAFHARQMNAELPEATRDVLKLKGMI